MQFTAFSPVCRQTSLLLSAAVLWLFSSPETHGFQQRISIDQIVGIELKEEVTSNRDVVLLSDVATISCGDSRIKDMVEQVELCELKPLDTSKRISQLNVRTRLVLAGMTLEQIRFSGPREVVVNFGEPNVLTDDTIETEAHRVLCQEMGVESFDLTVQLQSTLMETMSPKIQSMNDLKVKVVPPNKVTLGSSTMGVQFWKDDRILVTRFASFNVRKRHRVAIARASLSKELPLDGRSIEFADRFLAAPADELVLEQIEGRNVKAVVPAGAVLQLKDLQLSRSGKAIAIKKGENVKVVAINGKLRIQMMQVEAMQDGGIGEVIELRNRETGKTFSGEVTAPGRAVVRL